MANVAAAERHVQQEYKPREKQIIQSTLSCLMELGWERTTFEEISRRAGTPRGSIFYYFKTRENLMIEVLNYLIASFSCWSTRRSYRMMAHGISWSPS